MEYSKAENFRISVKSDLRKDISYDMLFSIRRSSMHREFCGMNEGRRDQYFAGIARLREWAQYAQSGRCGGGEHREFEQEFIGRGPGRGFGRGPRESLQSAVARP